MLKQFLMMLLLSAIFGLATYTVSATVLYSSNIEYVAYIMGYVGMYVVILVAISFLMALIPRCVFWIIRKKNVPDLNDLAWSFWMIMVIIIFAGQAYSNYVKSEIKPATIEKTSQTTATKIYQKVQNLICMV